jgi:hypothetical protein
MGSRSSFKVRTACSAAEMVSKLTILQYTIIVDPQSWRYNMLVLTAEMLFERRANLVNSVLLSLCAEW